MILNLCLKLIFHEEKDSNFEEIFKNDFETHNRPENVISDLKSSVTLKDKVLPHSKKFPISSEKLSTGSKCGYNVSYKSSYYIIYNVFY